MIFAPVQKQPSARAALACPDETRRWRYQQLGRCKRKKPAWRVQIGAEVGPMPYKLVHFILNPPVLGSGAYRTVQDRDVTRLGRMARDQLITDSCQRLAQLDCRPTRRFRF